MAVDTTLEVFLRLMQLGVFGMYTDLLDDTPIASDPYSHEISTWLRYTSYDHMPFFRESLAQWLDVREFIIQPMMRRSVAPENAVRHRFTLMTPIDSMPPLMTVSDDDSNETDEDMPPLMTDAENAHYDKRTR